MVFALNKKYIGSLYKKKKKKTPKKRLNKNGNEADLTMRVSENCAFIQITRIRYFQLQNRCRNSHGRSNIGSTSMRILIECIDRVYIISRKKKPYIYMWISDRVGVISPFFWEAARHFRSLLIVSSSACLPLTFSGLVFRTSEVIRRQIVCTWSFDQTGDEFRESRLIFDPGESSADLSFSLEIDR